MFLPFHQARPQSIRPPQTRCCQWTWRRRSAAREWWKKPWWRKGCLLDKREFCIIFNIHIYIYTLWFYVAKYAHLYVYLCIIPESNPHAIDMDGIGKLLQLLNFKVRKPCLGSSHPSNHLVTHLQLLLACNQKNHTMHRKVLRPKCSDGPIFSTSTFMWKKVHQLLIEDARSDF